MKNLHVYKIRSMVKDGKQDSEIVAALKLDYTKEHVMLFINDVRGIKAKGKTKAKGNK